MKEFIQVTNSGIKKNPADHKEDKNLLMSVMRIISDVKDVEPSAEGIINRIK